jgi:hypothetical protein
MTSVHHNYYNPMGGFVNLDIEMLTRHMGQEIEYFELWDANQGSFKRGKSYIHGIYKDKQGITRIYSDTIWGTGLESALLIDQEGFCFSYQSHIYLAPVPFQIYRISWLDDAHAEQTKLIPVESDIEVHLVARRFTEGTYWSLRVNLDGSVYRS